MPVKTLSEDQWKALSSKKVSARDRVLQEYVDVLREGKIVQVTPEPNVSIRGMKASLSRRASRSGFKVEYRDMDKGFAARKR